MSDEKPQKQVDKYILSTKQLGKGVFGTVWKGWLASDKSVQVAVKVTPMNKLLNEEQNLKLISREIEIMKKVEHPKLVRLMDAVRTSNNLYLFLEYCNSGNLKTYVTKNGGKLTEANVLKFFIDICEGFHCLYINNIMHRDIKPENILVHDGTAKITDFGFARFIVDSGMEDLMNFSKLGTPLYTAPQILEGKKFSCKCDIWSLGIMLFELLYGQTPWTGNSIYNLVENIKAQKIVFPKEPAVSQKFKDLIGKMLMYDDHDRMEWNAIFKHELINLPTKTPPPSK